MFIFNFSVRIAEINLLSVDDGDSCSRGDTCQESVVEYVSLEYFFCCQYIAAAIAVAIEVPVKEMWTNTYR